MIVSYVIFGESMFCRKCGKRITGAVEFQLGLRKPVMELPGSTIRRVEEGVEGAGYM